MARQGKTLPARRTRSEMDDSLLIRSAESLGRMIGSLQRQLDGASRKLNAGTIAGVFSANGHEADTRSDRSVKTTGAKTSRAKTKTAKGGSKSRATKVRSTADRTSKRASKPVVVKKSAGRSRSGGSRKSAKGGRT